MLHLDFDIYSVLMYLRVMFMYDNCYWLLCIGFGFGWELLCIGCCCHSYIVVELLLSFFLILDIFLKL